MWTRSSQGSRQSNLPASFTVDRTVAFFPCLATQVRARKSLSGTPPTIFPSRFLGTTPKTGFFCTRPPLGECQKSCNPSLPLPPGKDPEQPRIQEPMYRGWPGKILMPALWHRKRAWPKGNFWPCPECFFGLSNQGRERKTEKAPRDCTRGEGMQLLWDLALFFCFGFFQGSLICPGYTSTGKRPSRSAACEPGCSATLRAQGPCGAPRGKSAS